MAVKKLFLILTLPALLAACASAPASKVPEQVTPGQPRTIPQQAAPTQAQATQQQAAPAQAQAQAQATQQQAAAPAKARRARPPVKAAAPAVEELPSVPLTADVMVKFLAAEIANQRGRWQGAYVYMLGLAQQTRDPRIARRAAEIALNARQAPEALAAVRLWRELAPASDEATQFYLGLLMLADNLTEALPLLQQKLAETRPALRGSAMLQIQRLGLRARNKAAAFNMLEDLFAPYDNIAEAHVALAQQASAMGDGARAVQEARRALALSPASELGILTLAQVLPEKEQSLRVVTDFLRANPNAREVRLAYARMLVEEKQYDAAREQFHTLLKSQPEDLTVLYALGLLGTQRNDLAEAERYLTAYLKILASHPEDERDPTQALMILSQVAEQRNDIAGALKWLDQIDPASQKTYITAQVKRAQLLAKSEKLAEARAALHETRAEGEEDRVQLLVAEAQILRSANQVEEAMTVLEAGIAKLPENPDLLYDYAMLAEKLDKLDVMETALRKVIRISPTNQHAYNALGYSLAERNMRLEEAFTLIERALSLAPEDPFIMDSMGWVQFRLGRLKEAEALLRKAYSIRPDPEIAVHLGEVLWVIGQRDDARKFWRDASTKDPKNDVLRSTLARLQVKL
ncbi:tetratricopeptide repeat protein [Lacisediminimonas profundi]|uniref:tetratricopeptide repeat protein n=1 Tax=Lacisediminimonas profundi TaxID=2603856 RepID=UPI00124B0BD0|nr:tetratricopeptide repeat protein [Lacisediminimonas profundi]